MIDITVDDITNASISDNGVVSGTGIFDKLMQTSILHIEDQLDKNHLTQGEAGQVYSAMVQNAMQQAVQFVLQEKVVEADIALKEKQLEISAKELEIKAAQLAFTERQTVQVEKQTSNLENQDLLTLAQIGKTKIDADVASVLGAKEVDIKEQELVKLTKETTLVSQKVIGRKQ